MTNRALALLNACLWLANSIVWMGISPWMAFTAFCAAGLSLYMARPQWRQR